MKKLIVMAALTALAACGADAPPMQPSANLGLNVTSNGVTPSAGIAATNGTVSLGLNL